MIILKRTLLIISVSILFCMPAIALENDDSWSSLVKELIQAELESTGTPSFQVAIGKDTQVIFNEAFGLADVENNVQATPNTKYRIGSVSKWITATSVMALVDQGQIDLDSPIQT